MRWALVCLAACSAPPKPRPRPAAVEQVTPALPDVPFAQLDDKQREQFMHDVVVPAMRPIFASHVSDFRCRTCHGPSADGGDYRMPNPDLPRLDFHDLSPFKQADIDWMMKDVKPAMAKLLRMPEMSREVPDGFGCESCHVEIAR